VNARNHTRNNHDRGHEAMRRAVEASQERAERWKREGERSLGQNLAMIGSLGWLIVVPTLAGVAMGRWLDHKFGTGIQFTGALIAVGVALGGWLAWRRIGKE
jgi:ATP synthase protein I